MVLALDVGVAGLGSSMAVADVDGFNDLFQVSLNEISTVELHVTVAHALLSMCLAPLLQ